MSRISALKNKISKLQIKIIVLRNTLSAEHVEVQDKEIILLKQEGQYKQKDIDSLVDKLYTANKELRNANESIVGLTTNIKSLEDRKFKNRLKKLFVS